MASSFSYSDLIDSLESAQKYVHRLSKQPLKPRPSVTCSIKIGIRNLKSLVVWLPTLDDDGALHITRINPMLVSFGEGLTRTSHTGYPSTVEALEELHGVWKRVVAADELSNGRVQLKADEAVSIIIRVLANSADFRDRLSDESSDESISAFEALESFGIQMRFIKHLLRFATKMQMQACVEEALMFRVQPVAINAAIVFFHGTSVQSHRLHDFFGWSKEVESKCWTVNRMAAEPQLYRAYAQALTAIRHNEEDEEEEEEEEEEAAEEEEALSMEEAAEKAHVHWLYSTDDDRDEEDENNDRLVVFLDSFISLLWDLLRRQPESRFKDQYKLIFENLRYSRAIWKIKRADKIRRREIGVLICDAGAFIFSLHQTDDPGRYSDLLRRFDVFHAQFEHSTIPSFKADHKGISTSGDSTSIKISDDYSSPTSSSHQHPQVVGFKEDELQLLLDRLIRGSKQLRIVPICGMPGLGKTTLALKLYNHPSVKDRFQARAWCTISQVLDKKKVLAQLLNQILPGDYLMEAEQDLADKLRRSLKGKPYLILLDDIWIADAWDSLKASFPNDSTRSRIICTSRCLDIVPHDQRPHLLRLRSVSECFDILKTKVPHKESWNTRLVTKIAKKCNGLPLTVTIVAGLLATSEPESWKGILDHLSSGGISGCAERALEFSYQHLPDYLRPCFLYFGAFPEDAAVPVKRLIRMWMAEGLVGKRESKRMEDVAQEYVEKLIERSLVMAVKGRSLGGVSSCRIHDVVHDFCRSKAKNENLFHLLLESKDQLSDFNEPRNLQRLFVDSTATHFLESRLFCPRAQSIVFFTEQNSRLLDLSFIIQIFRILKVLDMSEVYLTNDIPSSIQLLTQLRFFAITSYVPVIPSSIGNLSNLETFIARFDDRHRPTYFKDKQVSFPHTLWNLRKLRYLRVSDCHFTLPIENLDNSSCLLELETLDGACFYTDDGSMEKQMEKFPNVRTLNCTVLQRSEFPSLSEKIVIPEFLSQLESLAVRGNGGVKFEFGSSAENLRKLKLEKIQMSREDIAVIGRFSNLEVLVLSDILYSEKQLEMEEEEFTKLRILKLISSESLERWTCSDDQAFCLEKLLFKGCENLEEIPFSYLGDISTLEQIRVQQCSSALESAVRSIKEVQKDYGNQVQVDIQRWWH